MPSTPRSHAINVSNDRADDIAELARTLRDQVLSRAFQVPLLPDDIARLLTLAIDPTTSTREIEVAIRHEPLLAAKVVASANSPIHAARGSVTSLHQAALRLGASLLRQLVAQAIAEAHVFTGRPRRRLAQLRVHSIAVGYLARYTCALLDVNEEDAFLCGLLHDMGHPIVLSMLAKHPVGPSLTDDERDMLSELLHPIVGERVARAWSLPEQIGVVCRFHHCYLGQPERDTRPDGTSLTAIVAAADHLACRIGLGDRNLGGEVEDDPLWAVLGLDDSRLASLRDYADRVTGSLS